MFSCVCYSCIVYKVQMSALALNILSTNESASLGSKTRCIQMKPYSISSITNVSKIYTWFLVVLQQTFVPYFETHWNSTGLYDYIEGINSALVMPIVFMKFVNSKQFLNEKEITAEISTKSIVLRLLSET